MKEQAMEKQNHVKELENTLYIICPAGRMESEIRRKKRDNMYFLTSLGAVVRLENYSFVEELGEFLKARNITSLTIAQDIQCRFIQTIIDGKAGYGTYAEEHLRSLWIEHFFKINNTDNPRKKAVNLAKAHVRHQLDTIKGHSLLSNIIRDQNIGLNGLIMDTLPASVPANQLQIL